MTLKRSQIVPIVVVAILLLLCVVAALTYWMVGPSPLCDLAAKGPAEAGWSARTVVSGNRERCYHLYVPPEYDPARPAPVVLSLHGFLSNPNSHALITGWHKLANEEGFLVVYPQGTSFPQRWNAGATWGTSDVNDVQFFRDLMDDLSGVAAVDRSRVYVNGLSNGGGMSVRIACEVADRVTAIGSVAGAIVDIDDCSPSHPVPVMAFHGTADPVVPYEGGELQGHALSRGADLTRVPTSFVGAEEWVARWAEHNGCDPVPETIPLQEDVQGVRYTGCDQSADTILYTIEEGGHTWPGGMPIPGVGKTTRAINATKKLWQFFEAYTLEDQP